MGPASHSRTTSAGPKKLSESGGYTEVDPDQRIFTRPIPWKDAPSIVCPAKKAVVSPCRRSLSAIQRSTVDPGADLVGLPDGLRSSALHLSCVSLVHDSTDWPLLKDL